MERNRAALYCRLSREDAEKQGESESIQNQKALLCEYAKERGWEIWDIFSDEDYSGADRTRPAFNRLLAEARKGLFNIVLVKTQSRFTRDMELVEKYIHGLFPLWGIRFVAVVDNADTNVRGNKKARQINGLVNASDIISITSRNPATMRGFTGYAYFLHGKKMNQTLIKGLGISKSGGYGPAAVPGYRGRRRQKAAVNETGLPR